MSGIFTCLANQHDPALVVLAGILCFVANLATVTFIGRARQASARQARFVWIAVAAGAGGFGIWSTHFVGMLAYNPGVTLHFEPVLTLVSLALAFLSTFVAALLLVALSGLPAAIAAGVIFGLGVSCMHFAGMSAVEFNGSILWAHPIVLLAIAAAVLGAPCAFVLSRRDGMQAVLSAAAILSLAIVCMHFIAMGAVTLIPDQAHEADSWTLSKPLMLATIIVVSMTLIGSGFAGVAVTRHAARSSRAIEANFELLVRGVTDYAIYMLDVNGVVSNWNAGAERAKGYTAAEIVGENFARFYSPEDRQRGLPEKALRTAREEGRFDAEGKRYRKDGSWFWAHVIIQPVHDERNMLVGYTKITRDITRQKEDSDRIAMVSQNLDLALQNMTQGICLFDRDERLILANGRYREIFRLSPEVAVPGMRFWDIVLKGHQLAVADPDKALAQARLYYDRNRLAIRSGQSGLLHRTSWGGTVRAAFNPIQDGGWVATFEDISEQVKSEEQLVFMRNHDVLTGLPNRLALMERLRNALLVAKGAVEHVAVVAIDLNEFKQVNDQLGHSAGDEVLREIGRRLREVMREQETVARFGGDEFMAVMRYSELGEVQDFLDRLSGVFRRAVEIEGHMLNAGASMGVALYPHDGLSAEALIANADLAMYRAKASLSRDVCFYDIDMDEAARDRAKLAKDLWDAVDKGQLFLHYQVQKSVTTAEITGYEVLLRWQHPERGHVSPADFIAIAEECGAILPIGEWVLREACREAATWPTGHKVAVNLSPVQIAHADMPALVRQVLAETGLAPHRLELEITESSIIEDKQTALQALTAIKLLGVSIAIDDFGTGYSSLETLRAFPFDKIKLDRSFLTEISGNNDARAMIRALLALGQGLRIPVLAEGVETPEQLDILRQEGCQEVQGYLLGRPLPMQEQAFEQAA